MLMNIAEDLKEYAKIKVSPMQDAENAAKPTPQADSKVSKKGAANMDDMKKQADSSRQRKNEVLSTEDAPIDDEGEFLEGLQNYIYMELQSTVAFKEIDIDQMLQHTTLDDFLRGLYVKAVDSGSSAGKLSHHDKLMAQLMGTVDEGYGGDADSKRGPALMFDDDGKTTADAALASDKTIDMFRGENLRKMALQNLKDRRQRQKQSEIFNQQEALKQQEAAAEDEEGETTSAVDRIDLTQTQMAAEQEGKGGDSNQIDDFDLLEAKIDPKDIRTSEKVAKLQDEIEYEKIKIKVKFIFKYSMQTNDPLKISE